MSVSDGLGKSDVFSNVSDFVLYLRWVLVSLCCF